MPTKKEIIKELTSLGVKVDESQTNEVLMGVLEESRVKFGKPSVAQTQKSEETKGSSSTPEVKMMQIPESAWNEVQEKLKMLTAVADKGRVFNYENSQPQKKSMKVKLSLFKGGIIIGWKTLKDELIKHPTSGATIGEKQEYEIKVLKSDGSTDTVTVDGYEGFSAARYTDRVEADVVGKKEDYDGKISFELRVPDFDNPISLDSRFVN